MEELALSRGILRLLFRADEEQRIKQKARQGKNPSLCGPSIPKQRCMRVCMRTHAHTHATKAGEILGDQEVHSSQRNLSGDLMAR